MSFAVCMTKNQLVPAGQETSKNGLPPKIHRNEELATRPSFASRMAQFIFRKRRSTVDERPKSWPGCPEPVAVPVPTPARHQPSPSISIPNSLSSSTSSATRAVGRTQSWRIQQRFIDDNCSDETHWRHRQAHCVNCERLFFTSLSSLSGVAGRFCSLDCKTNFEYVNQLQDAMNEQMLGLCLTSSGSFDTSSDEDECCWS